MTNDPYYLIRRSHLPEVMRKTVEAMELLQRSKDLNVSDVVQQVGISRSAFYKYKDIVKPFYSNEPGRIITISLMLRHFPGVLSEVLNTLSKNHGNILTINQSLPLQGLATVIVSLDTRDMAVEIDSIFDRLRQVSGVEQALLVGQS